jgi:DNA-binding transcriptional regulator LsrR (DeoR family)
VTGDDIVVETAWLYYEEGLNQNEIAARLNVSRATVVNYLQEARERGYVQVRLSAETFTGHRLARALRDRFGLAAAYVVPDGGAEEAARVVRGAADWLPHLLEPGDRLGSPGARRSTTWPNASNPDRSRTSPSSSSWAPWPRPTASRPTSAPPPSHGSSAPAA